MESADRHKIKITFDAVVLYDNARMCTRSIMRRARTWKYNYTTLKVASLAHYLSNED